MCSLIRTSTLAGALAGIIAFTGCQTHDRAAYQYDREPVRTGKVKLQNTRTTTGGLDTLPADDPSTPPIDAGGTGLQGPTLIP